MRYKGKFWKNTVFGRVSVSRRTIWGKRNEKWGKNYQKVQEQEKELNVEKP